MRVLDPDGDGELSADEIQNAPAALKAADANQDGKLTPEDADAAGRWWPWSRRSASRRRVALAIVERSLMTKPYLPNRSGHGPRPRRRGSCSARTCFAAPGSSPGRQPNFVFILGEGHGWSSTSVPMDDAVPESKSAFVRTPNFERLAQAGMRFANFYAPSPRCTPSRAAFFTGKSPAQLHMTFVGEGKRDTRQLDATARVIPPPASMELPTSGDDHRGTAEARRLCHGALRQVARGAGQSARARLRRKRRRDQQRRPGQRGQSASQATLRHDRARHGFHDAAGAGRQAVLPPTVALRLAARRRRRPEDASPR